MAHCPDIILLGFRYLNDRRVSPEPDAEIPEAQGGEKALSLFHLPQGFLRDGSPGGDAGGEAGIRWLVPDEQAGLPAQGTNVGLGQTALPQGRADLQFPQGLHAGTVPCVIGGVGPVDDQCVSVRRGLLENTGEDAALAVIAAVRGIGGHLRILKNVSFNNGKGHAALGGDPFGVLQLKSGLEGGMDIVGAPIFSVLRGRPDQQGRVHSAGKGQCTAWVLFKKIFQFHVCSSQQKKTYPIGMSSDICDDFCHNGPRSNTCAEGGAGMFIGSLLASQQSSDCVRLL